ncbi:MAG TPA: biopolymer transporter ExbD [Chitinophagaceae bacterium]|jgi:biopolymer transport protein ExbD
MKLRKGHRQETELFTDSLNDILFILLMFFLITTTMANPNVVNVNNPRATKDTKAKQHIVISIDKDQKFYLGQTPVDKNSLDSVLTMEIRKWRATVDTPSVIINADTGTYYGEVFRVMRIAQRDSAKVAALVKPG